MPKVITSLSQADARGIYVIFQKAIAAAIAVGTAKCGFVAQFPWGPDALQTAFESPGVFRSKFAPGGFDRTGAGYNICVQFPWADLQIIRAMAAGAVKAVIDLQKAGPANCVTTPALWKGAAGNGITCTVAAASNGVANSFDLTVTKTNATTGKSTSEIYRNVDSNQVSGPYWTNLTATSVLLGPLVKNSSGRPANGVYTLATGTDGSGAIAAADYIGTPGSPDVGISLFEREKNLSFLFCDDVGASLLATVNAGLAAHQNRMLDRRFVLLTGNPLETDATAKTNAALNQGDHVCYVFPHGLVLDEDAVNDASPKITVPLTGALASIASLMQPHISPAFKRKDFTKALKAIKALDAGTGTSAALASLELSGVLAFEQNADNVFSPYCSVCTNGTNYIIEKRMADFLAFSISNAMEEYRNGPNDDITIDDERAIAKDFLAACVNNRKIDHIARPCLNDAGMLPTEATNTQADLDAGMYTMGLEAKLIAEQKKIIISMAVGTSVKITGTSVTSAT